MHQILITDAAKLRQVIDFAEKNGCLAELGQSMLYLFKVITANMVTLVDGKLEPSKDTTDVVISNDFALNSFGWAIYRGMRIAHSGGICIFNGGFLYEGPRQPLDGSGPAFAVSLNSDPTKHSWGVHT